jgi:hypothetical protein
MKYFFFLIGSNQQKMRKIPSKPHVYSTSVDVYGVFHVQGLLIFYNYKKLGKANYIDTLKGIKKLGKANIFDIIKHTLYYIKKLKKKIY